MSTVSSIHQQSKASVVTRIGILSAILFVAQVSLAPLPNVEIVSVLVLCYTLVYGIETYIIVTVFSVLEVMAWGFGLWTVSYFYVWAVLVTMVLLLKKIIKEDMMLWSIVLGLYGLMFGGLFALVYLVVDPSFMMTYWIAGIPWDVWHAITNTIISIAAGTSVLKVIKIANKQY